MGHLKVQIKDLVFSAKHIFELIQTFFPKKYLFTSSKDKRETYTLKKEISQQFRRNTEADELGLT